MSSAGKGLSNADAHGPSHFKFDLSYTPGNRHQQRIEDERKKYLLQPRISFAKTSPKLEEVDSDTDNNTISRESWSSSSSDSDGSSIHLADFAPSVDPVTPISKSASLISFIDPLVRSSN